MKEKFDSDTTIAEFKKRFPTKDAWENWLSHQPRSNRKASDFFAEAIKKRASQK